MEREKRSITKPLRYQTTSSEEEPCQRKKKTPTTSDGQTVFSDINDIRRIIQHKEDNTQHTVQQKATHTHTSEIYTNIESDTNIQTHTHTNTTCTPYIPTQTGYTTHIPMHTNIDYSPHITTYAGYSTYPQTHTTNEDTPQTHTNTHNFILQTERDKTFYSNDTFAQFPDAAANLIQSAATQQYHMQKTSVQRENTNKSKIEEHLDKLEKKMDNMGASIQKIEGTLQKILQCVQHRYSAASKPCGLPMSTVEEMDAFENIDEERYFEVVHFLIYVGGFNSKEAIQLCLKETMSDILIKSFTWLGREEGRRPLCKTRLVRAIYDALCRNRHFDKPTRSEFQQQMQIALRTAKERHRQRISRATRPSQAKSKMDKNPWADDESEEEDNI